MNLSRVRGDVVGGLVSAAVAIPLAMGYGMFAFASLGESYFADGALAGIATAFVVATVCVALGDKTTTVYAPRVTSTFFLGVLIYGLVHSDRPEISSGGAPLILAVAFSIVLLAGAIEALFGLARLGTLIKFTPQPVMAGFQNAAAALLFLVQLGNVCGFDHTVAFTQVPHQLAAIKPLSVAIAAITFAAMWNAKKLLPKVPPILFGIVTGSVFYYAGKFAGLGADLGPVIVAGPRAQIELTAFPYFGTLMRGGALTAFIPTIVGGALALAIIASIDALLCAKLVAAPAAPRRDGNALLARLGAGNLVAACMGGITSGINIGPSVANRAFGARTPLAVLVNAAVLLAAGALLFRWLGLIPRSVLSAVIMVIAIQHFDLWSLRLLRGLGRGSPTYRINVAVDLAVVVTVAVLSIALDIVSAVFIGVAIAVGLFVLRMSRSIVRRSYRCSTIHSRTSRTASERTYLDRAGEAVLVLELQGALFFGTGERMLNEVDLALQTETSCVILDLRRLTEIDSTGATALLELKTRLVHQKKQFLLALAEHTPAMERLENFGVMSAIGPADFVADVDRAIERAEDQLLREHLPLHRGEIALADVGLLANFDPGERAAVEHHLRRVAHRPGEVVFHEGDPGNELFVLTKGTASAYLELPKGNIRLATFSPGTVFGELALLDAGVRSATVVADDDIICYALSTADFAAMAATSPNVAIRLLAAIGRELSGRLRTANRTIHQLET